MLMIGIEGKKEFGELLDSIRRGALFWRDLTRGTSGNTRCYYVFLFSEDHGMNCCTVRFLPAFMEKKGALEFEIVTAAPDAAELVWQEAEVPYTLREVSDELRVDLCRFFAVYYDQIEFKHIIISGTCFQEDYDVFRLIGCCGISKEDIVAASVLGLEHPPEEVRLKPLGDHTIDLPHKPIDWETANQHLFFDEDADTRTFEEAVRAGIERLQRELKITSDDRIVLCTATQTTRYIIGMLRDYQIDAVIDNDHQKVGQLWAEVPVYQTDKFLKAHQGEDYKFIVPTRSYRAICEQLNYYGYEVHKQVFITYSRNDYYTQALLEQKINDIEEGKLIYDKLREAHPTERLYICLHPGTGDAFLVGVYWENIIKSDQAAAYIAVVTSQSCRKVLELFGLTAIVLPRDAAGRLVYYLKLIGADRANARVLNDDNYYLVGRGLQAYKGLDFHTLFRRMVLRVENARPIPQLRQRNADHWFASLGLKKGKTVLLSPFSKSAGKGIPNEIWEEIVKVLISRGYAVCTNIAPEKEAPILGTAGIAIPYHELLDFLDKAGGFIGLRSGLCDVIVGTKARKVIFYPSCKYGSGSWHTYFSLKKMGLGKEELKEVEFCTASQDELMEAVLQTFHG